MPRVYQRSFDWDEARSRYEAGETIGDLAREYGVSWQGMQFAVRPEKYAAAKAAARLRTSICAQCGGKKSRDRNSDVCRICAGIARRTSVRETELLCARCHRWLPDEQFPNSIARPARRMRHTYCRACNTLNKREYRKGKAIS